MILEGETIVGQDTERESKRVNINMITSGWIFRKRNGDLANLPGLIKIFKQAPEAAMDSVLIRSLGNYIYED